MKRNLWILNAALALTVGAGALTAKADFSQGFETDTSGWITAGGYGSIDRVPSGNNGITSAGGSFHAVVNGPGTDSTGPFTRFGGYSSTFGGGWSASLDIYLNPNLIAGQGFDYSVSASTNTGAYLRDYIFHVAESSSGLWINASNNSSDMPPAADVSGLAGSAQVTQAGWYTFTASFSDSGGALAGTLDVSNGSGTLFTKTLSSPSDLISGAGGNHYGWFTFIDVGQSGLAIDNASLTAVPLPSSAYAGLALLGGLGLVSGAKRLRKQEA